MLLFYALMTVFACIVSLAVFVVLAEVYGRRRVKFYADQGFLPVITPFIGGYVSLMVEGNKQGKIMQLLHDKIMQAKSEGRPGIVCNGPFGATQSSSIRTLVWCANFSTKRSTTPSRYPLVTIKWGSDFSSSRVSRD